MKKAIPSSPYFEFCSPGLMFILCSSIFAFYKGTANYHGIVTRGMQTRIGVIVGIVYFLWLYLYPWYKLRYKTYRILLLLLSFMAVMILGCHFIPWWNVWMAIPLTILWYPAHRRILDGLPRKKNRDYT